MLCFSIVSMLSHHLNIIAHSDIQAQCKLQLTRAIHFPSPSQLSSWSHPLLHGGHEPKCSKAAASLAWVCNQSRYWVLVWAILFWLSEPFYRTNFNWAKTDGVINCWFGQFVHFALYRRTLSPNMAGNSQKRWEFRAKWIILLVLGCSGCPRASNNWSTAHQNFKKFSLAKLAAVQNKF